MTDFEHVFFEKVVPQIRPDVRERVLTLLNMLRSGDPLHAGLIFGDSSGNPAFVLLSKSRLIVLQVQSDGKINSTSFLLARLLNYETNSHNGQMHLVFRFEPTAQVTATVSTEYPLLPIFFSRFEQVLSGKTPTGLGPQEPPPYSGGSSVGFQA